MSNYRQIVLEDSPVSYWQLGELSGTAAVDQMGLNNGAYSGTGYTLGVAGALFDDPDKAVAFDATDGQLNVPHSASLAFTTACTIEAWVMMNALPLEDGEMIISKRFATGDGWPWRITVVGYGVAAFGARFTVSAFSGSANTAISRAIPIGTWSHIVGVYTGSLVRLYVDGVEQGVPAAFSDTLNNVDGLPVNFGHDPVSVTFSDVSLDELAVYNYALSPERIMAHYTAGVGAGLNQPPSTAGDFPASRGRG